MDCYWSLYNTATKVRIDGLKTIQARAVAISIAIHQREQWMVWKEGSPNWGALADHPELLDTSLKLPVPPPFPPDLETTSPAKGNDGEFYVNHIEHEKEATAVFDLQIDDVAYRDLRAHARFIKNFPVTVSLGDNQQERMTENLSMGGIKIRTSLPGEFSGKTVKVVITRPDGTVELTCQAVPNPAGTGITRLIITENPNPELFRKWLF
jgi:hypothetical protein